MKPIRSIKDVALEGRSVFVRLDLNVPLSDGEITSDARIRAALPTIKHVIDAGGRIALASHLGRPKGKRKPEFGLEPVGERLSELLKCDVILSDDCVGDGVRNLVREARPGAVLLLQNLRYHAEEEANDPIFARALASPFDVYINDAFGASHRAHASIVGMVRHFNPSDRAGGFLLEAEAEALGRVLHEPAKPFVAVIGGAKVSDKLGVLEALLGKVDALCIGGAMAYTFLKARNVEIGASRCEDDRVRTARDILERAKVRGVELLLPQDHVAASEFSAEATPTHVATEALGEGLMGLDIGPRTQETFSNAISGAGTVFWNGPMGVFEWSRYAQGTFAIAQAAAAAEGYVVVGGGDSVAAIEKASVAERIDHVSTGGGASLELIEKGTLPGLEVLAR
jgi:phosphoglycerate kinase